MKNNRNMKRKGFTLVELLIVIVVIGVLSAMMMLSSTEAVSSARASNIVSNLRNLKTAALAYYVDNLDKYDKANVNANDALDKITSADTILKYLSGSGTNANYSGYGFKGTTSGTWYVYYNVTNDGNVKTKLAGRAGSTGLIGRSDASFASGDKTVYTNQNYVAMFIR